jgi:hypothetical protein
LSVFACGLVAGAAVLSRCPQLVAFTPAYSVQSAATAFAQDRPQLSRLINTAYVSDRNLDVQEAETPRAGLATVNALKGRRSIAASKRPETGHARYGSKYAMAPSPEGRETAQAELAQQQWMVLTAWEQVETFRDDPATSSDQAAQTGRFSEDVPRAVVTQLIFRIVPATSKSTQPVPAHIRGSWFVIQL